jgi:phosphatidylserine/phosphatidylglycerophosphate/cardiolipin synthase-like enzyme
MASAGSRGVLVVPRGVVVLACVLTLVAGGLLVASEAALAARAGARAGARVTITRTVTPQLLLAGDPVAVRGRVRGVPGRARLRLQQRRGGRWATVRRTRTSGPLDRYGFRFRPPAGRPRYRVAAVSAGGRLLGRSRPFAVRVGTCRPMAAPSRPATAWFSRPGAPGTPQIARRLGQLFCAAAPGATVDVAMYFIRAGSREVEAILRPLELMARARDVRVRVLLEGALYPRSSSLFPTLERLRRFATVRVCRSGCRSDRPASRSSAGILHHKFVTVSDMSWQAGADPVTVSSSANWSSAQLDRHWQSAVMSYDDRRLFREFDIQWQLLRTCAGDGGCAAWARRLDRLGLSPDRYGVTRVERVWHDVRPRERSGGRGRGTGVMFSPWSDADPVAARLRGYTCSPEHGQVRVAHMFVSTARTEVLDALAALQSAGCDVRMVVSPPESDVTRAGLTRARRLGLRVACVPRMHDKVISVDAVDAGTRQPERVLWAGSQNLGGNALRNNDEALLRVSVDRADGAAADANARVFRAYQQYWSSLRGQAGACR